eukprot:s590_g30.t1
MTVMASIVGNLPKNEWQPQSRSCGQQLPAVFAKEELTKCRKLFFSHLLAMTSTEEIPSTKEDTNDDEEDMENYKEEIDRLVRRHRNERHAPEILPFDQDVVESVSELLHFVDKSLKEDRASGEQGPTHPSWYFRSLEAERLTYLLSDYLRIRLRKLWKYPQYYLDAERQSFLSSSERVALREYWDLKSAYLENRFLCGLPESWRKLDQVDDLRDMIRSPCLQSHVYARIHAELGQLQLTPTKPGSQGSTQDTLTLDVGEIYLIRYEVLRQFLVEPEHDGKVQLV